MLQTISMQNAEYFEYREGHHFEFQSLGEWKSLKLRNEAGPTCQSQQPLNRVHRSPAHVPSWHRGWWPCIVSDHRPCAPPTASRRPYPLLVEAKVILLSCCRCWAPHEAARLSALRTAPHTAVQPSMSNWGKHAPGLCSRALLRLPDMVVVLKVSGEQRPEHPRSRRLRKKHLAVEPRLQPLSAPKRTSPSYEVTPSSSPTQPPGASTSGPSYRRQRPSSSHHHRGECQLVRFFPAPTPKSGCSPRRPPPRPVSPPLALPARREFGRPRHPTPWGAPPYFAQGLAAQPWLGRPEAAQVHSRSS
jgi:hypothetical protein